MAWYAIYETATGRLASGTEDPAQVASPLPPGFAVKEVPAKPDFDLDRWDEARLAFVSDVKSITLNIVRNALAAEGIPTTLLTNARVRRIIERLGATGF